MHDQRLGTLVRFLLVFGFAGCAEELTGPRPGISASGGDGADSLPVSPAVVCRAQLTTPVEVRGGGFAPVPIDVPDDPRAALPTITLLRTLELDGADGDGTEVVFSGDPDEETNLELLSWQSQEQMTLTVNQSISLPSGGDGELPAGVYDLLVANPNTNDVTEQGALAIVEKPTLQAPTPGIVCLAEGERNITLEGADLLELDAALGRLEVADIDEPFDIEGVSDCTDIAHEGVAARYCSNATVTLAQDSIDPGYPALTTVNPETAACRSEETVNLRVVPPPTIDRVEEPLACVAQSDRTFVIQGQDFLGIDGVDPAVTVGGLSIPVDSRDGCGLLPTMGHDVERCSALHITIPEGAIEPGTPEVVVTNPEPAGCGASNAVALTIVAPPAVAEVVPPLVCVEQGERVVEIRGSDFLTVGGVVPEVAFDSAQVDPAAVAAEDCEPLAVDRLTVERCSRLTVTLAAELLPPGTPSVTITNPDPAGCLDEQADLLTVVAGPTVVRAEPSLVCTDDGSRQVTITGTDFLNVESELPTVSMDGVEVTVNDVANCTTLDVNGMAVESCTTLDVTVGPGALAAGDTLLEVTNPAPAGCAISDSEVITVPPSLSIAVADGSPAAACDDTGVHTVTVAGTGFLRVGDEAFTVSVAGTEVAATNITGCIALDADGLEVESCTGFSFELDTDTLAAGGVAVTVQNPEPEGCGLTAETLVSVTLPPTVAAVEPNNVCSNVLTTLTLTGTNFVSASSVVVAGVTADSVSANGEGTELVATFDGGVSEGTQDVTVSNGVGCTGTLGASLVVDPTPIVFFVKPQVLYSGITISATIFTSGLAEAASSLALVPATGDPVPITNFSSSDRPNRIVAEIPSGLASGNYEVRVVSELGCVGGLSGGVVVTDTLTLALDAEQPVAPAFASPTVPTAVTLFADTAGAGFEAGATVYLSPVAGGTATELGAVVFEPDNAFQLTAVVPAELDAGAYDLIVVNPSGSVGLAPAAVTVTVGEPPTISSVEPVSFSTGADAVGTVYGANFDTTGGIEINLICTTAADTTTTYAATVDGATLTATSVSATFPSASLAAGDVCLVELTNLTDGATFQYSAISARNPAQNLFPWALASTEMVEARRGLVLEAARPTSASRFLYAIGGDEGTTATAKSSVESASSDVFGRLGNWATEHSSLPAPRTLAGSASVGSFVYLVGGHDGSSATNTLLRAQVLDPLAAPAVLDVDATLGDSNRGLGGGLWLYRISATFPSTDANNPGGESLAGDVFSLQLPDDPRLIVLTVSWSNVTGASGYRVYRSPTAGATVDDLELLAETSCGDVVCTCGVDIACEYTDDGQVPTEAGENPLRQGSLGTWYAVTGATLTTAREGHATVAVPNPAASDEFYLYAFGGRDSAGVFLDSYEWSRVTVAEDGRQTVSAWTLGSRDIGIGKAGLGAWAVSSKDTSVIGAGQIYVFVGTGLTDQGDATDELVSGSLTTASTDGDLAAVDVGTLDVETGPGSIAASTCEAGAGYLYVFGGESNSGNLVQSDSSSMLEAGPDLDNWNALGGGSLIVPRSFAASTTESAFYYVAGGRTETQAATASVERTVQ